MIKNYFTLALRSFQKDRTYALINLIGLAIAFAAVMLIVAFIRYERSFDRHYSHSDRIYRLVEERTSILPATRSGHTPTPLAHALKDNFPEIAAVTHFSPKPSNPTSMSSEHAEVSVQALYADEDFFAVFNLPFITGSPTTTWKDGDAIVLTETIAKKLFPHGDAMGKTTEQTMADGRIRTYRVNGVIENIPDHTHFQGDVLLGRQIVGTQEPLSFNNIGSSSQYVLLHEGVALNEFEAKVRRFLLDTYENSKNQIHFLPVTDIHLKSAHIQHIGAQQNDIRYIYIYGAIALIILFIACVNYINLTSAKVFQRLKEVGMRKVLGASRTQVRLQFVGESLLLFLLAVPLATLVAYACWPYFCRLLDISNVISYLINLPNILVIVAIGIVAALLSGWLPAGLVDRGRAIDIFKKKGVHVQFSLAPRKVLIVMQFCLAVCLVVTTLIVHQQLRFLNNRSMGFDENYLLVIPGVREQAEVFKQTLLQHPTVESISFARNATIGADNNYGAGSSMNDPQDSTKRFDFGFLDTDLSFQQTMKIELVKGRYFTAGQTSDFATDGWREKTAEEREAVLRAQRIVVTESLAKRLGIVSVDTSIFLGALQGTIIGIAKDFRLSSFKEEGPMVVLRGYNEASGNAYVRIANHSIPKTIDAIETTWKTTFSNKPFEYYFADDKIRQMYEWENRLVSLFTTFAALAIAISALGLFSLVALMVKQRMKEIGIRKVMGATVIDISALFSKDFIKLVFIAILIASPIAWWAMSKWLEDYAYRIDVSWWIFAAAGTLVLLVAMITVNLQAMRAAQANPVDSLRDE